MAVALAATALAGAAAPSAPSFRMTVSPDRARLPGTTRLVYRLRVATGAEPERFAVDVVPPLLQTRLGSSDNVRREGATITPEGSVVLEGPGTLLPAGEGIALIGCSPSTGLPAHGYEPRFPSYVVELPARSVSTLVARYRTGEAVLWPGSDLRLTMRATRRNGAATLGRTTTVRSPQVALVGRTSPRIELWTTPSSSPGVFSRVRRLSAGIRLAVAGRVTPARAGRRVSLFMVRHGDGERPRLLASVRTNATGHLRLATRTPLRAGTYELWARTPNDAGGRAEHSCSMAFRIPYAG